MNISMIGSGYVGLVTGTLFADRGNKVVCVDSNPHLVEGLNQGKVHLFEPGLEELIKKSVSLGHLSFTTDLKKAVLSSEAIFIAVGTPSDQDGSFNLRYVESAAKEIARALVDAEGFKVIVVKSTVPQRTHEKLTEMINQILGPNSRLEWAYVSNPETLAEGTAIADFSKPDRIIIGTYSNRALEIMEELYHPFNIQSDRLLRGTPADAELAKLFSNTALAARVALVNEFARIADITPDADMDVIRKMLCEDSRIGYKFMFPSPGYGGSCFPKDVQGLSRQAVSDGYVPELLSKIHLSNEAQKKYISEKVGGLLQGKSSSLAGKKIGVWGLTFKPNTDDVREAASVTILTQLLNRGVAVAAYDPQDAKAREIFGERLLFAKEKYEVAQRADALVLLTEWKEFDAPDFGRLKELMVGRQLFDLRNRWLPEAANRHGFDYYGVGRSYKVK